MERVTFQRKDVQALLGTMVCVKINASDRSPLMDRFGVRGFPTLVLISPAGPILHNDAGAPHADGFADYFAVDSYNKAIGAMNKKDYAAAAPHVFFVTKWFPGTKLGKQAKGFAERLKEEKSFTDAYAQAKRDFEQRLEKKRAVIRKVAARKKAAREHLAEARALYKKFRRYKAYRVYRKVILRVRRSAGSG